MLAVFAQLAVLPAGCAVHGSAERTPVMKDADLGFIEESHFSDLLPRVLPEGLLVYADDQPSTIGSLYRRASAQADGSYFNGCFLAALSLKYAVTRDRTVKSMAFAAWAAHHMLVSQSGYPGLVARSFGKDSPSDPKCIFRRDGSGDALIGWIFGTGIFVHLAADEACMAEAASDAREIVRHMVRHDFKIHMSETEPAPYGDFDTPVVFVSIGHRAIAMEALASLALRLNPEDPECLAFRKMLDEKGYPGQCSAFYSWFPHHSDNCMAFAMNLVTALWNQDDPGRRAAYAKGAEEFWDRVHDWQMAFFALAYRFAGGAAHADGIRDSIDRLRNMPLRHFYFENERGMVRRRTRIVPLERRPMTSSYWAQNVWLELMPGPRKPARRSACRVDFLLAYWFGRYMGYYDS